MTDYADIPQVSALRQEQELVNNAITMIDGGGLMASFVITPPPVPPEQGGMFMMASSVSTQGSPPTPDTMLSIRAWLVQRSAELNTQLEALGITATPPAPEPEPPAGLFA